MIYIYINEEANRKVIRFAINVLSARLRGGGGGGGAQYKDAVLPV